MSVVEPGTTSGGPAGPGPRRYDASGRRAAAEARRGRVLDVAAELFVAHGWTATTIARVAGAAGVSTELVTSSFGTKGGLLLAAVRRVSYGPHGSLPESVASLHLESEPDHGRRVDAVVALACSVLPSMAPLTPVMHRAADQDPDARETWLGARARHAETSAVLAGLMAPGVPGPDAVDEIYTALLSETYLAFVDDCGWSDQRYAAWLRRTLGAAVGVR